MVELIFPSHPEPGERFDRWQWDGEKWVLIAVSGFAPLFSPNFSGMPTAPTPPPGSDDAKIATTAFVMHAISSHIAGVSSFNGRSGHVLLSVLDIIFAGGAPINSPHFLGWPEAETAPPGTRSHIIATTAFVYEAIFERLEHIVESWNGRVGDVELRWDDVEDVGGAPIRDPVFLGWPRTQTAPRRDSSSKIANTEFVGRSLDDLWDDIEEEFEHSVRSWNQRTGHVVFRQTDLSAIGGALLDSPHFIGRPTAPTAPPHTNSDQLATTRYVDDSIRSNPGPPGARGPRGPEGPQGIAGRGLAVVGHVNFVSQLPMIDNLVGDIWTVGPNFIGYWWDGDRWVSLGEIEGPVGPEGPPGPRGIPGASIAHVTPPVPLPPFARGEFEYNENSGAIRIWDGFAWVLPGRSDFIRTDGGGTVTGFFNVRGTTRFYTTHAAWSLDDSTLFYTGAATGSAEVFFASPIRRFIWYYNNNTTSFQVFDDAQSQNAPRTLEIERQSGVFSFPPRLVATLPVPALNFAGGRSTVLDAISNGFGDIVVGGGTNIVPVWCDGVDWRVG